MANATWPISLPKALPWDVRQSDMDPRIVSAVDVGRPRRRRRFTGRIKIYENIVYNLLRNEAEVLDTFIYTTLGGGVEPFDWNDPWPEAGLRTFGFLELPSQTVIVGGLNTRVEQFVFSLEEAPS